MHYVASRSENVRIEHDGTDNPDCNSNVTKDAVALATPIADS